MSDFEKWLKPQLPYFKPDRDLEVIVEVAFIEKAYESGRKAGLEEAAEIADSAVCSIVRHCHCGMIIHEASRERMT